MDKVIIEKNGCRYRVERFDTDGKKLIAQDSRPVEYAYKAGQFVVTTEGPQPANHYHVMVFDDVKALEPFDVIDGQFGVTAKDEGGKLVAGILDLANQDMDHEAKTKLAKDLLGGVPAPEAVLSAAENGTVSVELGKSASADE